MKKYDLESEDEPKRAEGDAPKRRDEDVRRSREAGSLESIREVGSAEPADRDAGISISEYMMDYENFKSKHHSRAGEFLQSFLKWPLSVFSNINTISQ